MNPLFIIIIFSLVIILLVKVGLDSLKPIPKRSRKNYSYRNRRDDYEPTPSSYPQNKSIKSSKDYRYLLTLLNGDHDGANRLVQFISDSYPDRNTQWCLEKAINDILRDRR